MVTNGVCFHFISVQAWIQRTRQLLYPILEVCFVLEPISASDVYQITTTIILTGKVAF